MPSPHCTACAAAWSHIATADAPGSAVFCKALSGTYEERPAEAFMLFVASAPSAAAAAVVVSAAAMPLPVGTHTHGRCHDLPEHNLCKKFAKLNKHGRDRLGVICAGLSPQGRF